MDASSSNRAWQTAVAMAFAIVAFVLFTRHNDFPFFYHTDEPGKVKQVLTGERNFHHPLLLLRSTELVMSAAQAPRTPQKAVETGRMVSAFFAALAVGFFVLLAWQLGGASAGILCGVLLVTHPVLFELAHYMKEDCSLLIGVAATFYGMSLYSNRPRPVLAALTGAAAGLAVSGKYIAFAVAGVALLQILCAPRGTARWLHALVFLAAAALVFSAINWEILLHPGGARGGLDNEFNRLEERAEEIRGQFQVKYLSAFGKTISVPILLGTFFWGWRRWRNRCREPLFTWILLVFPFVFVLALGLAPATKERYLLPAFALFCVLGALGIAELARIGGKREKVAAALLAIFAVAWHVPLFASNFRAFTVDDRRDLVAWLRENVPRDATIAHDDRVKFAEGRLFGDPAFVFPQKIVSAGRYVADLGTVDALRAKGVRYLALCEQDYHTALRLPKNPGAAAVARSRFYQTVFAEGKLLWERKAGRIAYLHPGLKFYELPEAQGVKK